MKDIFQKFPIRTFADEKGEIWFLANDICSVLGYANPRRTVDLHCKTRGVTKRYTPTDSGCQDMIYINEPNLYRLIVKSKKPEAEAFESWVMEEVLPSIRKTGSYSVGPTQQLSETDRTNLTCLCNHIKFMYSWWAQYEPAVRKFNIRIAASVHDHFVDGFFAAGVLAHKHKLDVISTEYTRHYPFHEDRHTRHQYYLAHKHN